MAETWGDHMGISVTSPNQSHIDKIAGLGVKWIRCSGGEAAVLPGFAALVQDAHDAGLRVLSGPLDSVPRYVKNDLSPWDLADYAAHGNYAVAIADAGVDAIEIGNEFNNTMFMHPNARNETHDVAAIVTSVVSSRIRDTHPDLPIITNGWSPWGAGPAAYYPQNALPIMMTNTLGSGAEDLADRIDGYGYHPYEMTLAPDQPTENPAWNACWWLRACHASMVELGIPRPFWLSEFGKWTDPADDAVQALFVGYYRNAFIAHRLAGVPIEFLGWHTLVDGESTTTPQEATMGLYKSDGSTLKAAGSVLAAWAAENWSLVPEEPEPEPPIIIDPPDDPNPPTTGEPTLGEAWTATLNGVTISDEAPYRWGEDGPDIFGWDAMRTADVSIPGGHGNASFNPDYLEPRFIRLPVLIDETSEVLCLARWDQLAAAWRPTQRESFLSVSTPARRYAVFGRPRRCKPAGDGIKLVRNHYLIEALLEFEATDPIFYGDERIVQGTPGGVSGGFSFPMGFPFGFGLATPGGIQLVNAGSIETKRLVVRVDATTDVTGLQFELVTTGDVLDFELTIPAGSYLLLDFATKRALLNGASSRSNTLQRPASRWPDGIPPGTHTLRMSATGDATATATIRPAYIT